MKFITIDPPQYVFFQNQELKTSMTLQNKLNQDVIFKIKTTAPKSFHVKPSMGHIRPNSSFIVECYSMSPPTDPSAVKDQFQVLTTVVNNIQPKIINNDFPSFWRTVDNSRIKEEKLKIRFSSNNLSFDDNSEQPGPHMFSSAVSRSDRTQSIEFIPTYYQNSEELERQRNEHDRLTNELQHLRKLYLESKPGQKLTDYIGQGSQTFSLNEVLIVVIMASLLGYFYAAL